MIFVITSCFERQNDDTSTPQVISVLPYHCLKSMTNMFNDALYFVRLTHKLMNIIGKFCMFLLPCQFDLFIFEHTRKKNVSRKTW